MADKPLFNLDAEGRWRLAYDSQQWVVQRRAQKPRVRRLEGHAIADSGWRGVSFIGSNKRVLARVLDEKGVVLTAEAQARLVAIPERFMDFIATLEPVADLGQRELPEPDKARTAQSRLPDGPDSPSATEGPSAGLSSAQRPEAA